MSEHTCCTRFAALCGVQTAHVPAGEDATCNSKKATRKASSISIWLSPGTAWATPHSSNIFLIPVSCLHAGADGYIGTANHGATCGANGKAAIHALEQVRYLLALRGAAR